MAIRDNLLLIAPQFTTDARLDLIIDMASSRVNRRIWGSKSDMATALLAAHILTRFSSAGAAVGGSVTAEKVGDIETQYSAINMKGDEELTTTAYGAQFAQMRNALGVTLTVNSSLDVYG